MNKELSEKAQRYKWGFKYYYNVAKMINLSIILMSFVISIVAVALSVTKNEFVNWIVFVTFIWGIISIYLEDKVSTFRNRAASIQEFYDIYVLGIDGNRGIMHPSQSKYNLINFRKFDETKYYGIDKEELDDDEVIRYQKENILSDSRMRKIYYVINKIYICIYILVMGIFSITMKLDFYNLALIVIIPSINILNYLIKNLIYLKSEISQINDIEHILNSGNEYTKREYQDFIYIKRKTWVMIPNYLYGLYKKYSNIFMVIEITELESSECN